MSRKKPNKVMVDFIELYRSEPCLWQVKSADYHDRAKKDAAYNTLAKKLGELEPGATKKSGLAKINNLRSAFRKEQKIVGTSADSIYKPVLWYFDLLEASTSNLDSDSEEESADNSLPVKKDVNDYVNVEGSTSATENVPAKQQSTPISRPGLNKKRNINDDLSTEVLTTVRDHFKAPRKQPDRYDLIGKTVAVRLRSLGKGQVLIAEKINDVLFEVKMGYLITSPMDHYNISARQNPNTTQTTPSTFIGASISETQNNGTGQSLYSQNN